MERIVLGKEGSQPFKIKSSLVSREHAEITISDNGIWTLHDLGSTNGTFVRDEVTGEMKQVSLVTIHPLTFVLLGPDNSQGCGFYARQVLQPGNYTEELEYMNKKEDEFEKVENMLAKKKTFIEIGLRLGLFVFFGILSFVIIKGESSKVNFVRLGFTSLVSQIIPFFFDLNQEKKKLKEKKNRFHHCPNPCCSHMMKTEEVRKMDCEKCHCK